MKENEYNRLRDEEGLEERHLSANGQKTKVLFILAKAIIKKLYYNPYYGLSRSELEEVKKFKNKERLDREAKELAVKQDNEVNFRGAEKLKEMLVMKSA